MLVVECHSSGVTELLQRLNKSCSDYRELCFSAARFTILRHVSPGYKQKFRSKRSAYHPPGNRITERLHLMRKMLFVLLAEAPGSLQAVCNRLGPEAGLSKIT